MDPLLKTPHNAFTLWTFTERNNRKGCQLSNAVLHRKSWYFEKVSVQYVVILFIWCNQVSQSGPCYLECDEFVAASPDTFVNTVEAVIKTTRVIRNDETFPATVCSPSPTSTNSHILRGATRTKRRGTPADKTNKAVQRKLILGHVLVINRENHVGVVKPPTHTHKNKTFSSTTTNTVRLFKWSLIGVVPTGFFGPLSRKSRTQ